MTRLMFRFWCLGGIYLPLSLLLLSSPSSLLVRYIVVEMGTWAREPASQLQAYSYFIFHDSENSDLAAIELTHLDTEGLYK